MCKELNEWHFNIVRMTETHLKDDVKLDGSKYVVIGKGQKVQDRVGEGVTFFFFFLYRKEKNFRIEKLDIGNCAMSEEILAAKVECTGEHGKCETLVVIVVCMTVEGERAARENSRKYGILRKIIRK